MAKTSKKKTALPKRVRSHQEVLIDDFLKGVAGAAVNSHSVGKIADATRLSKVAVQHMRTLAKGSITSWMRLFMFLLEIGAEELPDVMQRVRVGLAQKASASKLDQKIAAALRIYSEDEIESWLELLLARHSIESGRKRKN